MSVLEKMNKWKWQNQQQFTLPTQAAVDGDNNQSDTASCLCDRSNNDELSGCMVCVNCVKRAVRHAIVLLRDKLVAPGLHTCKFSGRLMSSTAGIIAGMKILNPTPMMTDPDTRRHLRNVGLVLSVLGVIAILIPQFVTLAVEVLLAWLLITAGAMGLLFSWRARDLLGLWYTSITFLLTLLLGLVFLIYPFSGIATMTLFLIALFTLEGLASLWLSAQLRRNGVRSWWWMVFSGISSLALAAFIVMGWPGSAAWTIGLLIGLNLLTTGISIVSIASMSQVPGK